MDDDEIRAGPEAEVDGRRVCGTAVLERTAVVEPAPALSLVNWHRLLVDPQQLRVRHRRASAEARRGRRGSWLQEHKSMA
jgi:hypothetical protein